MEIKFELENSDIECVFEPDFWVQQKNTADHSSVSWGLSDRESALNVGVLCEEFSTEISTDSTIFSCPDV